MCWIAHNDPKIKVAENDVKVLKIVQVNGSIISPYFYPDKEHYGNVINGDFSIAGDGLFSIGTDLVFVHNSGYCHWSCDEAIHSYLPEMITIKIKIKTSLSTNVLIHNNSGLLLQDYYGDKDDINLFMDCIIPKGTKYAINESGEVVSEKIKVIGFRKVN